MITELKSLSMVAFLTVCIVSDDVVLERTWSRGLLGLTEGRFLLTTISGGVNATTHENLPLIGGAEYYNRSTPKEKAGPVVLRGITTAKHGFWPFVQCEVTDDLEAKWKVILEMPQQAESHTLAIEAEEVYSLDVCLEPFKPFIGRYKYGRVVATNGDAAVFLLKHLQPLDLRNEEDSGSRP